MLLLGFVFIHFWLLDFEIVAKTCKVIQMAVWHFCLSSPPKFVMWQIDGLMGDLTWCFHRIWFAFVFILTQWNNKLLINFQKVWFGPKKMSKAKTSLKLSLCNWPLLFLLEPPPSLRKQTEHASMKTITGRRWKTSRSHSKDWSHL